MTRSNARPQQHPSVGGRRNGIALLTAMASVALLISCGDLSGPTPPVPTPTTPQRPVDTLFGLYSPSSAIYVAEEIPLVATAHDTRGATVFANLSVQWAIGDSTIVRLTETGPRTASIVASAAGSTTITASLGGRTSTVFLIVHPGFRGAGSLIVVDSFRIIEFQYPGYPGWFYAPEMRIREAGNAPGAVMTKLEFVIPGLDNIPPCTAALALGPGETMDLFQFYYGEFSLVIFGTGRATGDSATAILTVMDGGGNNTKVVKGPVVAGALPSTESGDGSGWGCQ